MSRRHQQVMPYQKSRTYPFSCDHEFTNRALGNLTLFEKFDRPNVICFADPALLKENFRNFGG